MSLKWEIHIKNGIFKSLGVLLHRTGLTIDLHIKICFGILITSVVAVSAVLYL